MSPVSAPSDHRTRPSLALRCSTALAGATLLALSAQPAQAQSVTVSGDVGPTLSPNPSPVWNAGGDIVVGNSGSGELVIENGGRVTSNVGTLGVFRGSQGAVRVSTGGSWTNSRLRVGGNGNGTLTIDSGGVVRTVAGDGYAYIGEDTGTIGIVNVTGAGSRWSLDTYLFIGNRGTATLTIDDGGLVEADGAAITSFGGKGTLYLRGTAAARGVLKTGLVGAGIGDASLVFDGGILRAIRDEAEFFYTFDPGEAVIEDGGAFIDSNGFDIGIGAGLTGSGDLTKLGLGTLTLTGASVIGGNTHVNGGTLRIAAGGSLSSDQGYIGEGAGQSGAVIVTGTDARWINDSHIYVGHDGAGALTIDNGATVSNAAGTVGVLSGSRGVATISGTGSTWTNAQDIRIGEFGEGFLNVTDGGTAIASGTLALGLRAGSEGSVSVSGPGSNITTESTVVIGNDGTGVLTIADGARVSGMQSLIAFWAGSHGTLNIGAAAGEGPAAAGEFAVPTLTFYDGDGTLVFNHSNTDLVFSTVLDSMSIGTGTGTHRVEHYAGTTLLTGDSSGFSGTTMVSGGTLLVGNAGGTGRIGGTMLVASGGTLGGSGTVGTTTVADGGHLAPGNSIGKLTVDGNLTLTAGSFLDFELGAPGAGAAAGTGDTIAVTGDLTLDGTINLSQSADAGDGTASFGYYRLITYGGNLDDRGLAVGNTPMLGAPARYAITAGGGNVDLLIAEPGDDRLQYWIGGDGIWNGTNTTWRNEGGVVPEAWASHHAVFKGTPGNRIAVEGVQSFQGLQFVDDGYRLEGSGTLQIDGSDRPDNRAEIRVLAGETATIATRITGTGGLDKTQGGTLVLAGNNSYSGGTAISGGTLSIASDANLGEASGGLTFDGGTLHNSSAIMTGRAILLDAGGGTFRTDQNLTVHGTISGAGALTKTGRGILQLTGSNDYNGGTTISAGTIHAMASGALGSGPVRITAGGELELSNDASAGNLEISKGPGTFLRFNDNASAGAATITNTQSSINFNNTSSAGTAHIHNIGGGTSFNNASSAANARISAEADGTIGFYGNATAGSAVITLLDKGFAYFHGNSTADGATIVGEAGGLLDISGLAADGIAIGSLSGNAAVSLGSKALTLGGLGRNEAVGGAITDGGNGGSLVKIGGGTLTLTGTNSYSGVTDIRAGILLVNGDQSGATGSTSVANGATLGGRGIVGGDVIIHDGGTLAPGASPGTLTINGDLTLSAGSMLAYEFGEANTPGGPLNDLVSVGGDLTLDGTLDVSLSAGGAFGAGVYRIFDYGGTLVDNGLALGTMPASDGTVTVQTATAGQVNLVYDTGPVLTFWDGGAGPKDDGVIQGGSGVWQAAGGNDNWTDADGIANASYADGGLAIFGGTGGTVTIDASLGDVAAAGMQFAADGYKIDGDALILSEPETAIRVGDGSTAGAGFSATIAAVLNGDGRLVKTDAGTLILSGINAYAGGTTIEGGTVRIAADTNLGDAASSVTLDGGTIATSASLASGREILLAGVGTIATAGDTVFTLSGRLSGGGALTKGGAGTLRLTGDSSGYTAATTVMAGTLTVDGELGGAVAVAAGARLAGTGRVGDVTSVGTLAPGGNAIGTLTIGSYTASGGVLEIATARGDNGPLADRLVVAGGTSGSTLVTVTDRSGLGEWTAEGLRIIEVTGASDGRFAMRGDYALAGDQVIIAGAYGYRLVKGGLAAGDDGDWYLRSAAQDKPLYQPGVPLYEHYTQTLQALNGLPTWQERVGNRQWASSPGGGGNGIWGRMETSRLRPEARTSSTGADANIDSWRMQTGVDHALAESSASTLVAGLTAHYGEADAAVRSTFGDGRIDAKGYGVGATLTFTTANGFYADAQAQLSWFDTRLRSAVLGTLADGNEGRGRAVSLEAGKRVPVGGDVTITPHIRMSYQAIEFDRFDDPASASVSSRNGDSLTTHWGIAVAHDRAWNDGGSSRRAHLYGLLRLDHEWLDGARVSVSGASIRNANDRLRGEAALGGSLEFSDRLTLYSQVSAGSSLKDLGSSYDLKGTAGVRLRF